MPRRAMSSSIRRRSDGKLELSRSGLGWGWLYSPRGQYFQSPEMILEVADGVLGVQLCEDVGFD